jgi:1-acyl-sn-glycerol-3-phosphate acyltransferase
MHRIIFYWKIFRIFLITLRDTILSVGALLVTGKHSAYHNVGKAWSAKMLKISGVKLNVIGHEKLDKDESYVYIANHSSMFDIPVIQAGINDDIRIMYKKSLEKVPIWGWGLKKGPYISIVRSDPRNAMKSIQEAIETVKQNASVLVYPEGTRSKDGKLQSFKRGGFMLASKGGKPIVPVTIIGSPLVCPKGEKRFYPTEIKVIIDEPIRLDHELSRMEEKELMVKVHDIIAKNLEENPPNSRFLNK